MFAPALAVIGTLGAVVLGGWLSTRAQERAWRRDHARGWRDARLRAYTNFLAAFREYVAFAVEADSNITAIPHPRLEGEYMPFFDEHGRPYRQRLEAAKTEIRLLSESDSVLLAAEIVLLHARRVAAARGSHSVDTMPAKLFDELWAAEREFITAARADLGLRQAHLPSLTEAAAKQLEIDP